jgi:hypothetical protein
MVLAESPEQKHRTIYIIFTDNNGSVVPKPTTFCKQLTSDVVFRAG